MYTSPTNPSRADINFMSGQDIVFHCNPRYDERALVLNSRFNGHWQNEERPYNFPLNYGQPTQVTVAVNDGAIDLFANKREFCYAFRHRSDVTKVNQVNCSGRGTPIKVWTGKALPDFTVARLSTLKDMPQLRLASMLTWFHLCLTTTDQKTLPCTWVFDTMKMWLSVTTSPMRSGVGKREEEECLLLKDKHSL
uniref:Galectin n=1 Tax=Suberites domuncula TaxID=55567 RepID=Q6EX97_SUBDO|nr:galectin [Suberites domuncula]